MGRSPSPHALAVCLLLAAAPASSTTIPPDSTSDPLDAINCVLKAGSFSDASDLACPPSTCMQACDVDGKRARASLVLSHLTIGRRYVETTVYTEFTVDPGAAGAGNVVDGTIQYDVQWEGGWFLIGVLTGFNGDQTNMSLVLRDVTASRKIVSQVVLHSMDVASAGSLPNAPIDIGGQLDKGEVTNSLTAKVVRGHTYRIELVLRAEGFAFPNTSVTMDYFSLGWGLWWNELRVAIGTDVEERLTNIENRLTEVENRVTVIEHQLRHHTHSYLTGRGEGHNNTVAATSEAIIVDGGPLSPEELKRLPLEPGGVRPPPNPSTLRSETEGTIGPRTTIRYMLPDRLPVSLRLYDALGRLVSTLVDAEEGPGGHEVSIDAGSLQSGVYYYRLIAGPYSENRKLMVVK